MYNEFEKYITFVSIIITNTLPLFTYLLTFPVICDNLVSIS